MKIGIDLDNTLICYDEVFFLAAKKRSLLSHGVGTNKKAIRSYIRNLPDGEKIWQDLQGEVYGKLIDQATLFAGAKRVLARCNLRGINVEVVSHKTEFANFCGTCVPLRDVAIEFLEDRGLCGDLNYSLINKVSFFDTREEKIGYIRKEEFDWFIDDLQEILNHPSFPDGTKKIEFCPSGGRERSGQERVNSWSEVEDLVLGAWQQTELLKVVQRLDLEPPTGIEWIGGRANSGVAKVVFSQKDQLALKIYARDEKHDRYKSEQTAFQSLKQCGETQTPSALGGDKNLGIGLISWVDGDPVLTPDAGDLDQALKFLRRLHNLRSDDRFRNVSRASAAMFCGLELQDQVEERFRLLCTHAIESEMLSDFLKNEVNPAIVNAKKWAQANWPRGNFEKSLDRRLLTLSPSDFGFHNCLKQQNGKLMFIDFEYFGWDDPSKLCVDFLLHPAMELAPNLKREWLVGIREIYGQEVLARATAAFGLLAISWCLIMLNGFRKDFHAKKRLVNPQADWPNNKDIKEILTRVRYRIAKVNSYPDLADTLLDPS
jgi:hypothetical protein